MYRRNTIQCSNDLFILKIIDSRYKRHGNNTNISVNGQ